MSSRIVTGCKSRKRDSRKKEEAAWRIDARDLRKCIIQKPPRYFLYATLVRQQRIRTDVIKDIYSSWFEMFEICQNELHAKSFVRTLVSFLIRNFCHDWNVRIGTVIGSIPLTVLDAGIACFIRNMAPCYYENRLSREQLLRVDPYIRLSFSRYRIIRMCITSCYGNV